MIAKDQLKLNINKCH